VRGLQGDAVLLFGMLEEGLEEGPQAAVPAAKREVRFLSALMAHLEWRGLLEELRPCLPLVSSVWLYQDLELVGR
jgi:hypothetical protein